MKSIPQLRFAHLPTPVESLPRLSAALGGPALLVKRDDQTGLAFGGNKTRKLEFLLAEAQANGARTLITAGALQSNHCRQTAAAARRYDFDCILVLYPLNDDLEAFPTPPLPTANLLIDHLLGVEIIMTRRSERDQSLQNAFRSAWEAGRRPYLIPYGGSNTTGAASYAFAMREFLSQKVEVDWIVFASSSGGTQSGLVLGSRLFGYNGKVLGISVDEPKDVLRDRIAGLATKTADFLRENLIFEPDEILVNADYLGGGYGVMGAGEREAIKWFAYQEGLLLDPVYTGRAATGLMALVRKGFFSSDDKVLFWHTGGTPVLFADVYQKDLA